MILLFLTSVSKSYGEYLALLNQNLIEKFVQNRLTRRGIILERGNE